jgi:hypothetical protein
MEIKKKKRKEGRKEWEIVVSARCVEEVSG